VDDPQVILVDDGLALTKIDGLNHTQKPLKNAPDVDSPAIVAEVRRGVNRERGIGSGERWVGGPVRRIRGRTVEALILMRE
jgi:hypothetical protein